MTFWAVCGIIFLLAVIVLTIRDIFVKFKNRKSKLKRNNISTFNNSFDNSDFDEDRENIIEKRSGKMTEDETLVNGTPVTLFTNYEFSVSEVEIKQKTEGELIPAPIQAIDGYVSPSGGYINYGRFQVIGINPKTKRKNKRTYEVADKEHAQQEAEKEGLVPPFEITVLPALPPSERQVAFAQDLEILLPVGACAADVSSLISRVTDHDEEPPDEMTIKKAHSYGMRFSRYIGKNAAKEMVRYFEKSHYKK